MEWVRATLSPIEFADFSPAYVIESGSRKLDESICDIQESGWELLRGTIQHECISGNRPPSPPIPFYKVSDSMVQVETSLESPRAQIRHVQFIEATATTTTTTATRSSPCTSASETKMAYECATSYPISRTPSPLLWGMTTTTATTALRSGGLSGGGSMSPSSSPEQQSPSAITTRSSPSRSFTTTIKSTNGRDKPRRRNSDRIRRLADVYTLAGSVVAAAPDVRPSRLVERQIIRIMLFFVTSVKVAIKTLDFRLRLDLFRRRNEFRNELAFSCAIIRLLLLLLLTREDEREGTQLSAADVRAFIRILLVMARDLTCDVQFWALVESNHAQSRENARVESAEALGRTEQVHAQDECTQMDRHNHSRWNQVVMFQNLLRESNQPRRADIQDEPPSLPLQHPQQQQQQQSQRRHSFTIDAYRVDDEWELEKFNKTIRPFWTMHPSRYEMFMGCLVLPYQ